MPCADTGLRTAMRSPWTAACRVLTSLRFSPLCREMALCSTKSSCATTAQGVIALQRSKASSEGARYCTQVAPHKQPPMRPPIKRH
mmetsp:Transcript_67936/g.114146  ORF Transcript_67936/g.114146 Transcript_67936/m.114146 type:complete len:86 (-) Transcript_67936:26-283(-)